MSVSPVAPPGGLDRTDTQGMPVSAAVAFRLVRALPLAALLVAANGCGSGQAKPAAAVAHHVGFDDSSFGSVLCPEPHTLASCFTGTATATLAPLGKVSIARTVISGDQKRTAPAGCDPADTVGTLTGADGAKAIISGTGTLCGAVASYTLLVDHGTGSFAKLHITGTIHNDGGLESWDIATLSTS
jgi:hypothetical protein